MLVFFLQLESVVLPLLTACRLGAAPLPLAARLVVLLLVAERVATERRTRPIAPTHWRALVNRFHLRTARTTAGRPFSHCSRPCTDHALALRRLAAEHVDLLLEATIRALLNDCGLLPASCEPLGDIGEIVLNAQDDSCAATPPSAAAVERMANVGATIGREIEPALVARGLQQLVGKWASVVGGAATNNDGASAAADGVALEHGTISLLLFAPRRRAALSAVLDLMLALYAALHEAAPVAPRYAVDDMRTLLGTGGTDAHSNQTALHRRVATAVVDDPDEDVEDKMK